MDAGARGKLVEEHLELVTRCARTIYPRVREHVEFDELESLGRAGLAEAAARFDPDAGASFSTFAWYRVHGAMIDGLRRATQLPRRTWAKLVALRATSEYLEHQAERDRGAAARGAPARTAADALRAVRGAIDAIQTMYMTSLEGLPDQGGHVPDQAALPPERLASAQLAARLRAALATLPERERALVTKHYFEGKNLLEAGAELGISKSWASRMHAQAVERLRAALADEPPGPEP
ncbi:MAG: sigma-70 family RNA polymerase sigma factor [Kofleriaceae bacterium]